LTGFFLESIVGPFRIFIIYLVSSVGAMIFATACKPEDFFYGYSCMGFIAGILAFIVVNWIALERQKEMRCCLLGMTIVLAIFWLLRGLADSKGSSGVLATLGEFIAGFTISCVCMVKLRGSEARRSGSYESKIQLFGGLLCLTFFTLCFTLFYTVSPVLNVDPTAPCKGFNQ
jgi:membrane associated rhomboid family serine protease